MSAPPSPASGGSSRRLLIVVLATLLVALLAVAAVLLLRPAPSSPVAGEPGSGVVRIAGNVEIGGPFALVDHTGRAVTDASFAGKFLLIYFGFTHCPDVCPTELQTIGVALDSLGGAGEAVQPLLISVDPARDTPENLAAYVPAFHPRLIGLTGSDEQVAAVAKAYRVYYAKTPAGPDGNYNVDHTSFVYLMGPDGRLRSLFRAGASPEAVAREIRAQLGAG